MPARPYRCPVPPTTTTGPPPLPPAHHLLPPTAAIQLPTATTLPPALRVVLSPHSASSPRITCSSLACFSAPAVFCSIASQPLTSSNSRRRRRHRHHPRRCRRPHLSPRVIVPPRRWAVTRTTACPCPGPRADRRRAAPPRIILPAPYLQLASIPATRTIPADAGRSTSPSSTTALHLALRRHRPARLLTLRASSSE